MSQLRHDPLSGRDVIVAAGRAARPTTFVTEPTADTGLVECPFCPGNEEETPPEVARVGGGAPNGPGWMVRAFPNLYPIVDAHEVVVLSPDHHRSFADLDDHGPSPWAASCVTACTRSSGQATSSGSRS
jgi:UDPglucose--hexose-1-phosphate uridylyltransferase